MIGPITKGNLPSLWAAASLKTALHTDRTNVTQLITKSEAQAMSHNVAGATQRTLYEVPQAARPISSGVYQNSAPPDITKQHYSMLATAQSAYHAGDYLPQNYNAFGQVARLNDLNAAGVVVNRVV